MPHRPEPWYREPRRTWFVQIDGKQIPLAKGPKKETEAAAYAAFHALMAERAMTGPPMPPATLTVRELCERFLVFSAKHHSKSCYDNYRYFLDSYCKLHAPELAAKQVPYSVTTWLDSRPSWKGGHRPSGRYEQNRLLPEGTRGERGFRSRPAVHRRMLSIVADVTQILTAIQAGDPKAAAELLPLVYDELRRLAAARLAEEKPGQTLQPTALVHEAYLRLVGDGCPPGWNGRGHFFSAAAEAMRRILVETARRKKAAKAGGDWERQPLIDAELAVDTAGDDLFAVDGALARLAAVELRFFLGMTLDEAAADLGVQLRTASRDWAFARAWLRRELDRAD